MAQRRPDTPAMSELSVAERRYQVVPAVIGEGLTVTEVASQVEPIA